MDLKIESIRPTVKIASAVAKAETARTDRLNAALQNGSAVRLTNFQNRREASLAGLANAAFTPQQAQLCMQFDEFRVYIVAMQQLVGLGQPSVLAFSTGKTVKNVTPRPVKSLRSAVLKSANTKAHTKNGHTTLIAKAENSTARVAAKKRKGATSSNISKKSTPSKVLKQAKDDTNSKGVKSARGKKDKPVTKDVLDAAMDKYFGVEHVQENLNAALDDYFGKKQ